MSINRTSFFQIIFPIILLGMFTFATLSLAEMPSSRISEKSLTVMNIYVHIKKENNDDAAGVIRQARLQAQREAFQTLAKRFTGSETHSLPEDDVITSIISNYEVENEQSYPVSYTATFNIYFRPTVLKYINQK